MRNAGTFQKFVETLITKYNEAHEERFEIGKQHTALNITNPTGGISPLEILNISKNIIYVHQPSLSDGMSDPGVAFFTGWDNDWIPIGVHIIGFGYRVYCTIDQEHNHLKRFARARQHDLASNFCNDFWVAALREQGFGKLTPKTLQGEILCIIQGEPELYVEYDDEVENE